MTVLTNLACQITAAGILRPNYADIFETLQATFKSIYGSDAYIEPDSQDGQLLAVFAKAVDDCNAACQATYNSFSPQSAQGAALSNNVKINGITRAVATHSTVDVQLTGNVGATINNGVVSDTSGNRWDLPSSVVIPALTTIIVTATAQLAGATKVAAGAVNKIETPTLGWASVTNFGDSTPGAPVETDANLRQRQTLSVAQPSQTILDGITGAVLAVIGVTAARVYENDTNAADLNGQPANSIAAVVEGGNALDVANAIMLKKTPGCYTQGSTVQQLLDPQGMQQTVRFFRPSLVPISLQITLKALFGYTTSTGDSIKAAVAAWINELGIGNHVDLGKLYLPAQLFGAPDHRKFEVNGLLISRKPAAVAGLDVTIAYTELATCDVADITLVVT